MLVPKDVAQKNGLNVVKEVRRAHQEYSDEKICNSAGRWVGGFLRHAPPPDEPHLEKKPPLLQLEANLDACVMTLNC